MVQDSDSKDCPTVSSRVRRVRDWLMRSRTIRIVGPAIFLLGVVLAAIGLLVFPSGDDGGSGGPELGSGANLVSGTAHPVPPEMVEGMRYLVPPSPPSAGFRLVIDSLGVNAQVVRLGLGPSDIPQVPDNATNVAWYEFTARPGTGGNAVLSGHVRWAGDPGVFADLDEVEKGDIIQVKWRNGEESVYEVFDNILVGASHPDALRVMAPTTVDTITLFTCAGTFVPDPDNLLGGDFTERVVVQARLVEPSVAALDR